MFSTENPCFEPAASAYRLLIKAGNVLGYWLLLLLFRLDFGYQFFTTGKGKLLDHQSVADFFATLHIPFPGFNAWFVGGVECIGGMLLILGLAARPVGLILSVNMTVAYLSVADDRAKVLDFIQHPIKNQDAFVQADPFFFLLTALLIFGFGAGPISIDRLIEQALKKKQPTQKPN
ncbi:MAG TPA: DoxX family protein [Candidatus Obscuribacterales bacterium]